MTAGRWAVAVLLGLVVLLAAAYVALTHPAVQDRLLYQAATGVFAPRHEALFEDGALHVFICGSSSPFANKERGKACVGAIAGGHTYLFDVGAGSWKNVELWRLPMDRLSAVFLTHFHSDHIGDLGETNVQSWIFGRREPLDVYGPEGVQRIVSGFNEAFALDYGYRSGHAEEGVMPIAAARMAARTIALGDGEIVPVFEENGVTISAFLVDHAPIAPAVGYRIDYNGRSAVISGDTAKSEVLERAARGADLLIHEAMNMHMMGVMRQAATDMDQDRNASLMKDVQHYHTSPVEAAESGKAAGVSKVVLYHLAPPPANWLATRMFRDGLPDDVVLGYDGLMFTLPRGSDAIDQGEIEGPF